MSSRPRPSIMPPSTRASMAPVGQQPSSRALAEELEKTEQSITLALQEIDRNFSRANKIVGESILPVIEKYSAQSRNMWTGAAFWKQFLEAAANVSLSGYEENAHEETQEQEQENDYISVTTPIKEEEEVSTVYGGADGEGFGGVQSTPNRRVSSPTKIPRPTSQSSRSTPRRESERQLPYLEGGSEDGSYDDMSMDLEKDIPPPRLSMAMEPNRSTSPLLEDDSSTFVKKELTERPSTPPCPKENKPDNGSFKTPKSVLRHQVLDKNWRIQATPYNKQAAQSPAKADNNKFSEYDSPDIQPPKLKSHIFDSPQDVSMTSPQAAATPVRKEPEKSQLKTPTNKYYDSDSDTDMLPSGMSPPVTMHFSTHVGNNDLVKTPARQAAKTIVDDILRDVGGADESESFASIGQQYTRYKTDWSDDDDL